VNGGGKQQQQQQQQEQLLESSWTFWYDKKQLVSNQSDYESTLKNLGSFNSIQSFWRHYVYLMRASDLPKNSNYHLFRGSISPMWENYPKGGCWNLKIKKKVPALGRMWEQLIFALIGEVFQEPEVVGIVLGIRNKDDVISVWIADSKNPIRLSVGEKIKQILSLDPATQIQFKYNSNRIGVKSA